MEETNKLDLGFVQIHKKAIADITYSAVCEVNGVTFGSKNMFSPIVELFGQKYYPGIHIRIDKNNQVAIEVKVYVRYGLNIADVAREVQSSIKRAIERTVDIDLKDINVNIHGIERGTAS